MPYIMEIGVRSRRNTKLPGMGVECADRKHGHGQWAERCMRDGLVGRRPCWLCWSVELLDSFIVLHLEHVMSQTPSRAEDEQHSKETMRRGRSGTESHQAGRLRVASSTESPSSACPHRGVMVKRVSKRPLGKRWIVSGISRDREGAAFNKSSKRPLAASRFWTRMCVLNVGSLKEGWPWSESRGLTGANSAANRGGCGRGILYELPSAAGPSLGPSLVIGSLLLVGWRKK